jgi:hypothetical protein
MRTCRNTDKLAFQLPQALDLLAHRGELLGSDAVRLRARLLRMLAQVDEFADGVDRQSEIACVTDEGQPFLFLLGVPALISPGPLGPRQKSHLLVVADSRHFHAGRPRQVSDRQHVNPFHRERTSRTVGPNAFGRKMR